MTSLHLTPEDIAGVIALRRDLHRHPELSGQEVRTAGVVADHLDALGLIIRRGVGGTGVVADLVGAYPGPTVLVRADMDALPIQEASTQTYASRIPGVMHACGHDGHTAVVAHVAGVLARMRPTLHGRVRFVFQPAEETGEGAQRMVDAGVMEGVDVALGLHLVSHLPSGTVGIRPGPVMASADEFHVRVTGRGGHAATPHLAIDPVLAAAHLIVALQALVSRESSPFAPAVLTVAAIHSESDGYNVIPSAVDLRGTLRTFDAALRSDLKARLGEMVRDVAAGFRVQAHTTWLEHGTPPVVNDRALTERARAVAVQLLGEEPVVLGEPWMAGEDMSHYLTSTPGVFVFVGAADTALGPAHPHHHPSFDVHDDVALPLAVELMANLVVGCLEQPVTPAPGGR